ncbi:MAG: ATP-dependent DNA helicase [Limisphaerales bacterium]
MSEAVPLSQSEYQVSVRRLVEFVLRTGDLGGTGRVHGLLRAHEGSRAHRKLQKSRPDTYESEVHLSHRVNGENLRLEVVGRVDGVWKRNEGILLEEIKTVTNNWDYQADPLHWAQLKVYGWIYCQQKELEDVELQLSYFHLETEQVTVFRDKFPYAELRTIAESAISEYLQWITDYDKWIKRRNRSAESLRFPHPEFRKGQRDLSRAVYKTLVDGRRLFVEAPTGTGKTISVLFPAIKSLPAKTVDRIFFLTARNTTQELARKSLRDLSFAGLQLRSMVLTAKEKLCTREGKACDPLECPLAKGYFDRRKPAILEALRIDQLAREQLEEIAQRHGVCPHELSLDVSEWVDLVICDYNYAFDPSAKLKRHFGENASQHTLLIDEAHNLVDRAREMFSASLRASTFQAARAEATGAPLKKRISRIEQELQELSAGSESKKVFEAVPSSFLKALGDFIETADNSFAENIGQAVPEPLLRCYFEVNTFLQVAEMADAKYRVITETQVDEQSIRLCCLDPSAQLHKCLKQAAGSILFSATLTPLSYFRSALGGAETDHTFRLPSPFPREHLQVLITSYIKTAFKHRDSSIEQVCQALLAFTHGRRGNYLVFFPSYAYLNEILARLQESGTDAEFIVQSSSMDEAARSAFLEAFISQSERTMVGFAVMGGLFGEGIDLVGERLIGVAVVGLGLPQIGLERNLIRNHFDDRGLEGFDFAYLFPGLNKVFQAAGRLIRSEHDRGVIMLVDERFTEDRVRGLLPSWWNIIQCPNPKALELELQKFWKPN